MAKPKQSALTRWLRGWSAALPELLKLAAILWAISTVLAFVRGMRARSPIDIAERLLSSAGFSLLAALVLVVAFQAVVFLIGSTRNREKT